jgi:hypothetical protein
MTKTREALGSDRELLSLATSILLEQGYEVEPIDLDATLVLAENPYFLVGVSAAPTIAQLLEAEGVAEATLARRLADADAGPKRWDAYLVLLTQERSPDNIEVTRELFDINYDTKRVRRIAHSGVDTTLASVRTALAPFVSPIQLDDPSLTADAFIFFLDALAARGVERDLAIRAIAAFQQGVPLGDVL